MARDCVGMILLGSCPIYLLFSWLFLIRAMSARSVFPDTLRWREWISCSPICRFLCLLVCLEEASGASFPLITRLSSV